MRLVEQHIIKRSSIYYNELQDLLHKCKNLYNKGLYVVRQHYFQYKDDNTVKYKYLNYYSLEKKLRTENDPDYRALPAPVAQQVLMMVDQNFKSFFNLLNKKNRGEYSEKVRIHSKKYSCPWEVMYKRGDKYYTCMKYDAEFETYPPEEYEYLYP